MQKNFPASEWGLTHPRRIAVLSLTEATYNREKGLNGNKG